MAGRVSSISEGFPGFTCALSNSSPYAEPASAGERAQAEVAEVVRVNSQMSLEILRRMSVQKDPALLERTITALRKAGLK